MITLHPTFDTIAPARIPFHFSHRIALVIIPAMTLTDSRTTATASGTALVSNQFHIAQPKFALKRARIIKRTKPTRPQIAYSLARFGNSDQITRDRLRHLNKIPEIYDTAHGLTLDSSLTVLHFGVAGFKGGEGDAAVSKFLAAVESGVTAPKAAFLVESLAGLSRRQLVNIAADFMALCTAGGPRRRH